MSSIKKKISPKSFGPGCVLNSQFYLLYCLPLLVCLIHGNVPTLLPISQFALVVS